MKKDNAFELAAQSLAKVQDMVLEGKSVQEALDQASSQWQAASQGWEASATLVREQVEALQVGLRKQEEAVAAALQRIESVTDEVRKGMADLRADALHASSQAIRLGETCSEGLRELREGQDQIRDYWARTKTLLWTILVLLVLSSGLTLLLNLSSR